MPTGTWEKIETKTLTSSGGFNFTSIPSTFTDIILTGQLRAAGGSTVENCWFNYNGDAGTNYEDMRAIGYSSASFTNDTSTGQSQQYIGAIIGNTGTSGLYTAIYMQLNNYANTAHYRPYQVAYVTQNYEGNYRTGNWKNLSSAINRIEFNCGGGGSFAAGSTLTIWGVKAS